MHLYLLDRTPLEALDGLADPPRRGDAIVYLRAAQDPEGITAEKLERLGIRVVWGETLLDPEASLEVDRVGGRFLDRWYMNNDRDVTRIGDVSLGKLLEWELGRLTSPKFVVRTGEILRRAIERYDEAEKVFSDLTDGEGIDRVVPAFRPMGCVAERVVKHLGRPF